MSLQITKEKVLEAAAKCGTARETLKTLFPEAFADEKYFNTGLLRTKNNDNQIIFTDDSARSAGFESQFFFQVRKIGPFTNKGFYLSKYCNWEIVTDPSNNELVLVPTKKGL